MDKMTVHVFAERLKISSRTIIEKALELGFNINTVDDTIEEKYVHLIRDLLWYENGIRDPNDKRDELSRKEKGHLLAWKELTIGLNENKRDNLISRDVMPMTSIPNLLEDDYIIAHGETGHTYESIFGDYLKGARTVIVEDPYILESYQVDNFARFCALAVKTISLKRVYLITSSQPQNYDYKNMQNETPYWADKRIKYFKTIQSEMKNKGIELKIQLELNLHTRKIVLDNGWEFIIDRGLDIYQRPENWCSLEAKDPSFTPCKYTRITIQKGKTSPSKILKEYGINL